MRLIIGIIALMLSINCISFAADKKDKDITTDTIRVNGTCGQCKKRIEDAAYSNGVKRALWDKTTKELTVTYRPSKTSVKQISEHVAKTGHDAGAIKGDATAYDNLPPCCAYKHDHAVDH